MPKVCRNGLAHKDSLSAPERIARGSDAHPQILALFIREAALVGAIGGILGLVLGACVIYGAIPCFGRTPLLRAEVAAGAILFYACVGVIAGILPARRASRIPASEALSYD